MTYVVNEAGERIKSQSCWKKRTRLERYEIIILAISFILMIALAIILVLVIRKNLEDVNTSKVGSKSLPPICLTPGCVHVASNVLKFINQSVDPCEDFYEFACGRFLEDAIIPDDKTEMNSFITITNLLNQQLRTIIEAPVSPNEPRPFVLLKKLYNLCMNTSAVETNGFTTVRAIISDLGGWPIIENKAWKEHDFDWKKSMVKFRKYGLSTNNFLAINVYPDAKNSSRRVIHLDQAELELSRNSLLEGLKNPLVRAYYDYLVELAVLFGANRAFAEYEVHTMLNFKIKLANISLPQEERRNETALYNPMTIKELQHKYPNISWLELINNVLALPDKALTYEDTVIVSVPQYISDLEVILRRTSKRSHANHAIFQAVRYMEVLLPENVRSLEQKFQAVMYGVSTRSPKWEECVNAVSKVFGLATSALYVRKYFHEDDKQGAVEMVSDIRTEVVKILEKVDWMDETTKKKAIEKALAMTAHIAYADELLDLKKLEDYYSGLVADSDDYLIFICNVTVFRVNKVVEELWKPINKTDWTSRAPPTTINAYYSLTENSIQFPAAILQEIFFNKNRLQSMNYGGIGTIIGHEMTHGFDDQGKEYDKDGNLNDWWEEKTNKAFLEKAKCIIDQYANYFVPEVGLNINGVNTQGENIADNGGIKEAYLAYNTWIKRNGEESQLPGLNYTAKQLFWISTAHVWCAKDRKEALAQDVLTDSHAPARYRILVPLSNLEYFAEDFKCAEGSKMNPKNKCKVW